MSGKTSDVPGRGVAKRAPEDNRMEVRKLTRLTLTAALVLAVALPVLAAGKTAPKPKPAAAPAADPAPAPAPAPAAAPEPPDNRILLAYRWKDAGATPYHIATTETTTTTTSNGPQEESKEKHTFLTVTPDGAGEKFRVWLKITYDRIRFKYSGGNKVFEADSAVAENPNGGPFAPLSKAFAATQGKALRVLIAPSGRIEKVEGLPELVAAVKDAWPADQTRDAVLPLLFPTTDAELAGQVSKALMMLPVKRAEPGFSMPVKVPLGPGDDLAGTLVFQAYEGEGPQKVFVVKQDMSAKPTPPQANPQDKLNYVREKYDLNSTARVTADSGVPVRFESNATITYSGRKADSDPATQPDKLVQTVTHVETTMAQPGAAQAPAAAPAAEAPPAAPAAPAAPAQPATPPGRP